MNMSGYYNNRYSVKTYNKRQESDKALEEIYEEWDAVKNMLSMMTSEKESLKEVY